MPRSPQQALTPRQAEQAAKQRFKAAKEDTYENRRLQGKPFHTGLSRLTCGATILATALVGVSVCTSWRANYLGVPLMSGPRTWGLFGVRGSKFQLLHEQWGFTYDAYGTLYMGVCSVICKWYQRKSYAYGQLTYVSYSVGLYLVFSIVPSVAVSVGLGKLTVRSIRIASLLLPLMAVMNTAAAVTYAIWTDEIFNNLNQESYYPYPNPSYGMYASFGASLMQLVAAFCACFLRRVWPDPDDIEDDEDDEDEDEDEGSRQPVDMAAAGVISQTQIQQIQVPQAQYEQVQYPDFQVQQVTFQPAGPMFGSLPPDACQVEQGGPSMPGMSGMPGAPATSSAF